MLRRFFLILSLALLFGLGQQGAAVHAISHFADAQGESQQDKKAPHLSFCDKCVVYAALDSAISGHAQNFVATAAPRSSFAASGVCHVSRLALHYAARAPPTLV